jgi:hypothetical protein
VDDTTWGLIETERRSLADLLEPLTPDQWSAPSLCAEWRIRDVAAHVAAAPTAELVTGLRRAAAVRSKPWFIAATNILPDLGSAAQLLLLMTGRRLALADVSGPGVGVIHSRTGEQRRPHTEEGARP